MTARYHVMIMVCEEQIEAEGEKKSHWSKIFVYTFHKYIKVLESKYDFYSVGRKNIMGPPMASKFICHVFFFELRDDVSHKKEKHAL